MAAGGVRAPAPPADDPVAKQVAVALRAEAHGPIGAFYAARGYWPLWVQKGRIGPAAGAFLHDLQTADLDGLNPGKYGIDGLMALIKSARSGDPASLAHAEWGLSRAFADYVRDVRRTPSVKVTYLDPEVEPVRLRPEAVLRAAALPPSFADYVAKMGWMDPLYVRLRDALGRKGVDGPADKDQQSIRLTLDRLRIVPGPWTRHIVVDAASARLFYYSDGKQQGMMRVVVGTPETQTPMLAGMVRYAILNPYWNVPPDLVQKRIAPKILAGASLGGLRYEALSDWSANPTKLDPATVDWQAVADGKQEVRLRQLPGGRNAMGKVKFMFPNNLGIYLHDSPDKALMSKTDRHLSNGCVRLEDAPRLGQWLLGKPLEATPKTPEFDVPLKEPVPVYLTYLTATPTKLGVGILKDVYGRDGHGGA